MFNPVIIVAILLQALVSRASRVAGAVIGFLITTGILLWGISLYGQGNQIALFGLPLSEPVFFLACLVWYFFDTRDFLAARKAAAQVEEQEVLKSPPAQGEPGVGFDHTTIDSAENLAREGNFAQAANALEEVLRMNPGLAKKIAGFPRQTELSQTEPVSGYALLVHLAGKAGNKTLAIQYVKRMLELSPKSPGHARQAAREAKVESETKVIAKKMGIVWHWWEY